ncbi:MAG: T9SS type A sorting domain-containing protein, partial [Candidatus Zixiibacteriota bacterium]
ITMIVTDSCGKADTCVTNVTVSLNDPPVAVCPGNQTRFVCDLSQICISGFSYSDPNNNIASVTVTGGTLSGNQVCFTPVVGNNLIRVIVTDSCGLADTCETTVTVAMNRPPVATCPGNQTRFVCNLNQLCLDGFSYSDPDNNIASIQVVGGTLSGNQVCFTPVEGANTLRLIVTDSCGVADTCETVVTVNLNDAPVAVCPGNSSMFVCNLNQICLPGFSWSDPNNNIASVTAVGGTLSGNQVCFTPVAGANSLKLIVTDSCGIADTCETIVTVALNQPPVANCPGNQTRFVCNLSQLCISGFSYSDPNNNIASVTVTGGTLSGNQVCFTPVVGANSIKLIVTDSCGLADTCETVVTVALNQPPLANCPGNQTRFVCNLGQLCVSGFSWSDPNNNIASVTVTGGTLSGNQVCFTPVVGANSIELIVTDSCGLADTCETIVTVALNQPPVANCPGNQTRFVCNLSQLCITGFSYSDPNNNIATVAVVGGILSGNQVCFTPVAGPNSLKLIVTDSCGLADTCETIVTVTVNAPPVATCPGNETRQVCDLSQICLSGFSASDPNNNLASVTVTGGVLNGNTVCVTPVAGANTIRLIATDSCGAADTCVTVLTVNLNSPPVVSCPANVAIDLFSLSEVCLPGFTASDPDGNLINVVVTGGTLSNDTVCFNPVEGLNIITITATDACGASSSCTTEVYVNLISTCPIVKIEKTHNTLQGHYQDVAITIEDASYDMGGFDFLIAYDASALTFVQATPGEVLTDCAWEYFTYRFGPFGNCGTGCPSGMIRIVALAETNNGPVSPDCFGPSDGSLHTLAILRFLVSNDRTLECQYVPIRFFWLDCGDNTIASVTGDTTFLDSKIFEFSGGLLWDEIDNVSFPEDDRIAYIGAPDYPCMIGEKRVPIRCIEFWNGGIDIICADSIDARGDVNLNGIPNEIGDAVTFTNYFIAGLAAFTVSIEGQIAATELNGDGVVLSVADLVYLIRVVIGDAQPLAKLTPFAESVSVRYNGSIVSVDTELGAALLVFAGDIPVTLGSGAYGMDIKTGLVDGNTHVLIYSLDRGRIFSGEILHANGALLNFEGSDYYGNAYRVVMNPGRFAVSNFPNPFNAQTVIRLELPSATDYEVTIYNISGQKVHGWSGYSEAGILELNWTADVASGIYFYKVQAGAYGVTRKMVLLK